MRDSQMSGLQINNISERWFGYRVARPVTRMDRKRAVQLHGNPDRWLRHQRFMPRHGGAFHRAAHEGMNAKA